MKKILILILTVASLQIFAQENLNWHTDVDKAINLSIKSGKPLFLFFTGKDWCPPCKNLKKHLLDGVEYKKWSDNVVLVELDFPRAPKKRQAIPANYSELARGLGVGSYPTIWIVRASVDEKTGKMQLDPVDSVAGGLRTYNKQAIKQWINNLDLIINRK